MRVAGLGISFVVPFVAYLLTLEPGVYYVDSGSHLTAAYVLGITNPDGFPSYILTAHLFSKLPFGSIPERIHLLSALSAALSCALVYLLVVRLLARGIAPSPARSRTASTGSASASRGRRATAVSQRPGSARPALPAETDAPPSPGSRFLAWLRARLDWLGRGVDVEIGVNESTAVWAGLTAALLLAFSYDFWSQAVNSESFAWTNLWALVSLHGLLTLGSRFGEIERSGEWLAWHRWFGPAAWTAAAYGVAAAGHPGIVCVAPAFVVFAWRFRRLMLSALGGVIGAVIVFGLALGVFFVYLPLRASAHPPLNWGDPDTWERFLGHIYGRGLNISDPTRELRSGFTFLAALKAFDVGEMFRSMWIMTKDLGLTLGLMAWQFSFVLVPLWISGALRLGRERRMVGPSLLAIAVTETAIAATYHGANNENWHITTYIVLALSVGYALGTLGGGERAVTPGMSRVWPPVARFLSVRPAAMLLAPAVLLLWTLSWHGSALARRGHVEAEELCENLYGKLPPRAIVIDQGDLCNSLNNYQRFVRKLRPDVVGVVDNMLHAVDWYRDNLRRWSDVKLSLRLEDEIRFRDLDEDNRVTNLFLADNLPDRPVYVTPQVLGHLRLSQQFQAVPAGVVYRILPAGEQPTPDLKDWEFRFRDPNWYRRKPFFLERNYRSTFREIANFYAAAYIARGDWEMRKNQPEAAHGDYDHALEIAPGSGQAMSRMGIYMGQAGRKLEAVSWFEKASRAEPDEASHFVNLGSAYREAGRPMEARRAYLEAMRLDRDPNHSTAGVAQQFLEQMSAPPQRPR